MSTPSAPASWSAGTPHAFTGFSPIPDAIWGIIFSRKCCHTPAHSSSNGASTALDRAATTLAAKAKAQHDLCAKPLSVLQPGTVVRVQHPRSKRWEPIAEVVERKASGRICGVKTESGLMLWRNCRFMRFFLPSATEVRDWTWSFCLVLLFFFLS